MIHVYCGDGKGKTTAAAGLALRMAGAGQRVVFSQFFKDGSSSEIRELRRLENVTVMHCDTVQGWFHRMSAEQQEQVRGDYRSFFHQAVEASRNSDLLVLDEIAFACSCGAVPVETVCAFLRDVPAGLEVVLTGRDPAPELVEAADYVTRMEKIKHPFDRGIGARKGIEY